MTPEQNAEAIRAIRERLEGITPGPWGTSKSISGIQNDVQSVSRELLGGREFYFQLPIARCVGTTGEANSELRNAEFIASAPAAVRALLAELKHALECEHGYSIDEGPWRSCERCAAILEALNESE